MHPDDEVFGDALALPHSERATFIAQACGSDHALRLRVEAMLALHDEAPDFLMAPLTARPAVTPEEKAGDLIGRYKLLQKIGEGGMGVVYLAGQEEPVRRRVALKIIKLGMDTKAVIARFEAERQALALMDHPNIARVFDGGATDTGRPYFVMEVVRGVRITQYCDEAELSTHARLGLFIQVCQAIQHAHQKGIIHRDIKPSNILVTVNDGVAVPKVIDFGIAKAIEGRLTDTTLVTQFDALIGTPTYMSPEQAVMTSVDVDTRSDIYSLGALLYEMLAGRTPFDAKELLASGLDEMRKTIREKEPVRPSTRLSTLDGEDLTTTAKRRSTDTFKLLSELKGDLDWIVMKCLEKDRARRYETANGLSADLKRHLNDEPVTARPPSAAYRFQKLVRRNKLAVAAATSIAAVLVLGTVVSTWQAVRATQATREAVAQRQSALTNAQEARRAEQNSEAQRNIAVELRKLADMQLALQAWEEGDLQRAGELIDASGPAPGQPPGFAWRYLKKLCQDQSIETVGGPSHPYRSAQFVDRDLLLLNDEKTLTLRDVARRNEQLLLEDEEGISSPAICPGDRNLLATATDDGRIMVWNLAAKRVLVELEGHPRFSIRSLSFSRDGRWLVSASSDNSLKLWDVEAKNSRPAKTLHRYVSWSSAGAFSSDGRHLFSAGNERTIRAWDVATGAEAGEPFDGHTSWVYALAMSPDGHRLASGSADNTVMLWDAHSRQRVMTLVGHIALVGALAFSPDGQFLVSGGADQTIRLWDMKTGQQRGLLRGHGGKITGLDFSPAGRWLVSRSLDGLVKLWDATPDRDGNALLGGGSPLEVAFSPDGRRLVSVGTFPINLWDLSTRTRTPLTGHSKAVMCAAFSPDGGMLATGSHDETVILWDVADRQAVATLSNGFPVGSLAFSPDGQTLVAGGSKHHFLMGGRGGLRFWDVPSRETTGTIPGDASDIVAIALSASGAVLATGHREGPVCLWDAKTRRLLQRFEGQPGKAVLSLAFSPAEPLLAASDWGGNIALYHTATMALVPPLLKAHSARVTSLAFSPDGRTLASAGEGGGLKLWHVATHQVALILKGHVGAVKGVAFSGDGNFMASCALDGTVRLWPAATLEVADAAAKRKHQ